MATSTSLPAQTGEPAEDEQTLPVPAIDAIGAPDADEPQHSGFLSSATARLPVELEVSVPVGKFRVYTLLALERDQVIETDWVQGDDLPLSAGDIQLAWTEFEVIENRLAVRVTRLA